MNFTKTIFSGIFLSTLTLAGCGLFKANSPENTTAKEVVTTLTVAVSILDSVCSQYAVETKDLNLAQDCAAAYNSAREKLLAAQSALENNDKSFVCTVKLCESALEDFANVYKAKSGELPPAVIIAESLGRTFGAQCK